MTPSYPPCSCTSFLQLCCSSYLAIHSCSSSYFPRREKNYSQKHLISMSTNFNNNNWRMKNTLAKLEKCTSPQQFWGNETFWANNLSRLCWELCIWLSEVSTYATLYHDYCCSYSVPWMYCVFVTNEVSSVLDLKYVCIFHLCNLLYFCSGHCSWFEAALCLVSSFIADQLSTANSDIGTIAEVPNTIRWNTTTMCSQQHQH